MNYKDFDSRYPTLAGALAGDFHDSSTVDDEGIARSLRADLPLRDRVELLRELISDARKLIVNIDKDWEVMAAEANRSIRDVTGARAWLLLITGAWQEELARLSGNP